MNDDSFFHYSHIRKEAGERERKKEREQGGRRKETKRKVRKRKEKKERRKEKEERETKKEKRATKPESCSFFYERSIPYSVVKKKKENILKRKQIFAAKECQKQQPKNE